MGRVSVATRCQSFWKPFGAGLVNALDAVRAAKPNIGQ
jgi:hypothetical protein